MQQAGRGQGEDAGEQKWRAAVGPGVWRLQKAEPVRSVAAAAAVDAVVVDAAAEMTAFWQILVAAFLRLLCSSH